MTEYPTPNPEGGIDLGQKQQTPDRKRRRAVSFISSEHSGRVRPPAAQICHRFDPAEAAVLALRIFRQAIRSRLATRNPPAASS
jgi:hypothetical protein